MFEKDAVWIKPQIVCTVKYMERTKNGLRQPVFKGIRDDKNYLNKRECL